MESFNIDEIMMKHPEERNADEIEFMIEWKAEQKFKEKAYREKARLDAEMRQAVLEQERSHVEAGLAALEEMSAKAVEAFERIERQ